MFAKGIHKRDDDDDYKDNPVDIYPPRTIVVCIPLAPTKHCCTVLWRHSESYQPIFCWKQDSVVYFPWDDNDDNNNV